jgi:hypothetical protein
MLSSNSRTSDPNDAVEIETSIQFSDPTPIAFDDVERLQSKGYLIVLAPFGRLWARSRPHRS